MAKGSTTLKVPVAFKERCARIASRTEAASMTEVLRRSISLYDQATEADEHTFNRVVIQRVNRADHSVVEEQKLLLI